MSIIVTRQINEITVNVTRNGLSTVIQPVISKNNEGGGGSGTVDAFSDVANGDAFAPSNYTVNPEDTSLLGQLNGVNNQFGTNNNAISLLQSTKQNTLVSGSNIKTVNGESLLGSGDLTVSSGFTQVAYSTALTFATNQISSFGDTDNSHTQSGAITFTYDFTNAVEGNSRIIEILSDGNTWTLPTSQNGTYAITLNSDTIISKNLNTITPVSGRRYQLNFDYSNGNVICYVIDVNTFTNDIIPPTFTTSPNALSVTATGFTLSAQTNENTTIYTVVVPDGDTAPNASEIIAGTGSGGTGELASGNANDVGAGVNILLSGLTATTDYDCYTVAVDDELNESSIVKIDVTTTVSATYGDYVTWYKLEESSGSVVTDEAGTNNGTYTLNGGTITYEITGQVNNAVLMGTTSRIETPNDAGISSFPFTLMFWNYRASGTGNTFISNSLVGSIYSGFWVQSVGNNLKFRVGTGLGVAFGDRKDFDTNTTPIVDDTWQCITILATDINTVEIRINNVIQTQSAPTGGATTAEFGVATTYFGAASDNRVDEIKLWDRILTNTELADIYALESAGNPML